MVGSSIIAFINAHSSILGMIEKAALNDLLALLKVLYPNDPVILDIVSKVIDEVEKLQGLKPSA